VNPGNNVVHIILEKVHNNKLKPLNIELWKVSYQKKNNVTVRYIFERSGEILHVNKVTDLTAKEQATKIEEWSIATSTSLNKFNYIDVTLINALLCSSTFSQQMVRRCENLKVMVAQHSHISNI
jgi:hypothetical protein